MEPGPEQTRTSGVDADWSVRGCVRRKKRRRQEEARSRSGGEGGQGGQEPGGRRRRRGQKSGQTRAGTRTRTPGEGTHRAGASGGRRPWTGTFGEGATKRKGAPAARNGKESTHKTTEGGERGQEEKESGEGRRRRRRNNEQAHETRTGIRGRWAQGLEQLSGGVPGLQRPGRERPWIGASGAT